MRDRSAAIWRLTLSALSSATRSTPYPIVIGGAGITGVELAAELAEGLRDLERQYDLKRNAIKVMLVEAASTVLPGFDRKTINEATRVLRKLGVEVRTNTAIERVEADRVWVKPIGSDASRSDRNSDRHLDGRRARQLTCAKLGLDAG